MRAETELKWLFLDLNSYFASVEQQEHPHLRGKPVAVVPTMTDATCAIAASYEAKAYGIKTGTKIYEAKEMCPNLTCIQARHDVYVEYHHRIIEAFEKFAPVHKVCSIDEFSSSLCSSLRQEADIIPFVQAIKAGIRKDVGESIRCSIGIGPNALLAKMATDMQKPDGLVILHPQHLRQKLLPLKLRDIPGVGVNMERRLNRAGVYTMEELLNLSPKHARKIWSSVQGERIWYWLHGYDFEMPPTQKSMVGHSRVLDPALRAPEQTKQMARQLLIKATYRLRQQNLFAGRLILGLRTVEGRKWSREFTLPVPANDQITLLHWLEELWRIAEHDIMGDPLRGGGPRVQFIKVSTLLMNLQSSQNITHDLFAKPIAPIAQKTLKHRALAEALDALQRRYKCEMVAFGVPPKTKGGHVGTKIAFNRVPKRDEFWS